MLQVYDRDCLSRQSGCRILYCGRQDSLHIQTTVTAIGDEIGYDFISHISLSQISLTSFCSLVEHKYNSPSKFMSRQTFTECIFAWLSNFKYEFRQACELCGPNPKILACDGTKLGIFFKNSSVVSIESSTSDRVVDTVHTRTERQFFNYRLKDNGSIKKEQRLAMVDLEYFIARRLQNPPAEDGRSESSKMEHLFSHTPQDCRPLFKGFVEAAYPQEFAEALCPVLKVFCTSSPLTSLINPRFIDHLRQIIFNNANIMETNLAAELPEISKIIHLGQKFQLTNSVKLFISYLIYRIDEIHQSDSIPEESSPLEIYNPETTGRAYYFTDHGGRVRDLPKYNGGIDDPSASKCRKQYQDATKGGSTFLFLWFDPLHGHCYGCHIIPQSEGRKDPFASALLYMDRAPTELFYDFSCQLEEYSLNREPGFWRNTRFFHDIFHGYSHKCSSVYNSKRLPALKSGINSEICEQFNSYIQKIKYSARAMSQSHFMFFVQFFIYQWNMKKRKKLLEEQEMVRKLMAK